MIDYQKYEQDVYKWLEEKNKLDPSFTFSLRMKGSKGAELDYFIGTEKSRYFAITFWSIPVAYPGSSSDCIDIIFKLSKDYQSYSYDFKFTQTNSPEGEQNKSVLNLLNSLTKPITEGIGAKYTSDINNKMFTIRTNPKQDSYTNLDEMLKDVDEDLFKLIPIVNSQIKKEKKANPTFEAHRISKEEFANMKMKLDLRFKKYASTNKNYNYWIFQGNPDMYNITNALKAAHLKSWKVAAHKDKIKIGDKVILWQTGKDAGCYSLAEVTSEVSVFKEEEHELWYYTNKSNASATERVKIDIEHYFAETPIYWKDIKDTDVFKNFNAGNQGTNFRATKEEYEELKNLIDVKNTFQETKAKLDPFIFEEYIAYVRTFIKTFELKANDPRVVFSVRGDSLNFIIGQKYCFNVYTSKNKENFGLISTIKLSNNSEKFSGKSPKTYYNYIDSLTLEKEQWRTVVDAIEAVLDKTTKSGYLKSNDSEFQNYVFEGVFNKKINMKSATNQILYGPPGTGKTFYLKNELFDEYTSKQTSISANQHFENVISNCSWWQVIAIALLDLGKSKVSDIFNHKWVMQKAKLSSSKTVRPTLWGQLQSHTINECEHVNVTNRQQPLIFNKTEDSHWEILEDQVRELAPELYELRDSVDNYNPNPDTIIKNYAFVTFHQSFAYEDFIEGIKPVLPENEEETKDLGYKIEDGVFKKLCLKAKNDPDNRYAIFIDEINRGNVSAIFGELITLIELDKRQGKKNEISIKLPYSKTTFSVPSNLDIYGTMNTADRSVEALDTALRRRFEFKEMMPDYTVIEKEKVNKIQLSNVLETINQRIELLIDRDHTIGHSYFVNVDTPKKLANAFNNKIVPLLQEYFYGDYGKIGLVLGKGFIKREKNKELKFSSFKYEGKNDFISPTFKVKSINETNIEEAVNLLFETKES